MNKHVDYNGKEYPIAALPENLMRIIQAGGLVGAMRKLNGLDEENGADNGRDGD